MAGERTTDEDVIAASGTVLDAAIVEAFVADAHVYVESREALGTLSEAVLELIEKWIACHYCWTRDETLRIEKEKTGQSDVTLEGRDRFLRNAMGLDPTGTIAEDFDPESEGFAPLLKVANTRRGAHFGSFR